MVHGWPDTCRLWQGQVEALKPHCRCLRFTLPGFDLSRPSGAWSLEEVVEIMRRIVTQTCPGKRVTLLLHDWGCLYGYQFALRHPQLVERIVGVDIGDAGSRQHRAQLGPKAKSMVLAYQLWLATAWRLGGRLGDRMARWMAGALGCPTDAQAIGAQMGYPYAVQWFGVKGGFGRLPAFRPTMPMLYLYGQRKPFMLHSQAWLEALAAKPGCRVVGLPTGHWVMLQQPEAFNQALLEWLGPSNAARVA
jgi:pimeloyl-ACP methyl ester carboxylesterase